MAVSLYYHAPLQSPGEQIRLLTVLTARDNDSIIEASLSSHKIPHPDASRGDRLRGHLSLPPYFAISYVCGSGEKKEPSYFD
jgi:hypothetical protein